MLLTNLNAAREAIAARLRASFAELGVDVRVETADFGSSLNRLGAGDFDMFLLGSSGTANPAQSLGMGGLD